MADMRKLLYVFRGKLEIEDVGIFAIKNRAQQLQGCTYSIMYTIGDCGTLLEYGPNYWIKAKDAPDEVKLAALLVN